MIRSRPYKWISWMINENQYLPFAKARHDIMNKRNFIFIKKFKCFTNLLCYYDIVAAETLLYSYTYILIINDKQAFFVYYLIASFAIDLINYKGHHVWPILNGCIRYPMYGENIWHHLICFTYEKGIDSYTQSKLAWRINS